MCCEGGILLYTLYDQRISSSLLFVVWIEIVVVAGFYGINKFIDNIQQMGMNVGLSRPAGATRVLLIIFLAVVTPGVLIIVAIIAWIKREPISYGGENFPDVAEGFGWLLELGPLVFLPIMAIWKAFNLRFSQHLSTQQMWKTLTSPSKSWYEVERDDESTTKAVEHDNMAYTKEET